MGGSRLGVYNRISTLASGIGIWYWHWHWHCYGQFWDWLCIFTAG
ncbi:unnamed protein product, partial [Diplocarpon coronariae]